MKTESNTATINKPSIAVPVCPTAPFRVFIREVGAEFKSHKGEVMKAEFRRVELRDSAGKYVASFVYFPRRGEPTTKRPKEIRRCEFIGKMLNAAAADRDRAAALAEALELAVCRIEAHAKRTSPKWLLGVLADLRTARKMDDDLGETV